MPNTLLVKRTTVAGRVPTTAQLAAGELAVNVTDGKLYLNITKNVVGFWESDIPGNLRKSEANWPGIEADEASTAKIPDFVSAAPVTN